MEREKMRGYKISVILGIFSMIFNVLLLCLFAVAGRSQIYWTWDFFQDSVNWVALLCCYGAIGFSILFSILGIILECISNFQTEKKHYLGRILGGIGLACNGAYLFLVLL